MSTERARKKAYGMVADAIATYFPGLLAVGWPGRETVDPEALLEVKRFYERVRAASEMELSPSALEESRAEDIQELLERAEDEGRGDVDHVRVLRALLVRLRGEAELEVDLDAADDALERAIHILSSGAGESAAAPPPAGAPPLAGAVEFSRGGEGQEPAAALEGAPPPASVSCDDATRWLNQGLPEGVVGAELFWEHVLECGRCGDAAASRALSDAARLG